MSTNNNKTLLYIYILGTSNEWNYIFTPVPYKLSEKELFFGPCKKLVRQDLKKKLLRNSPDFDLQSNSYKVYIVGINPSKRNETRKFLFAAKILKLFTFKYAWEYYQNRADKEINVRKMIDGIKGKNGKAYSPLHLKPIKRGYRHRTNEHENDWVYDLLSGNKGGGEVKKFLQNAGIIEGYDRKANDTLMRYLQKTNNEIFRDDKLKIIFERDCCFSAENIFFSSKDDEHPIPLNNRFRELLKEGFKKSKKYSERLIINKGPSLESPFGYSHKPEKTGEFTKYGREHLLLQNNLAENFMTLLYNSLERK